MLSTVNCPELQCCQNKGFSFFVMGDSPNIIIIPQCNI